MMYKLPPKEKTNKKGGKMLYNSLVSDLLPEKYVELNNTINELGELEIYLDFPGVPKETIEISQENSVLTVKGVKKIGKIEKEIDYKLSINKKFNLNETKAKLSDGILTLSVPKKEENVRKILIA